ncbi:MAG: acyl-CoA thioesterase [Gammaproteobacteria bacterium]|nr:acyl-CoA thioesterase [Gammaproteobacteria bacterium]
MNTDPSDHVSLPDEQPTMRLLARPTDTNPAGDIFGGWIMSQVDLAGSIAASRRSLGRTVTVAVNSFHFKKPVYVGDLISCYTKIEKVGNTSITVLVEIYAERRPEKTECIKVTEARLTYVAVDENGLPRPVNQ